MSTTAAPIYQDRSKQSAERAADLLPRLSVAEKISLLGTAFPGVARLGIAPLQWGGECLHGLVHTGRASVFPAPVAMAATFDDRLVQKVAEAIALEARAKYHSPLWRGRNGFISLAYWTPNINLFRDPRWGRGQETWGEDPTLTGRMGAAFVRGLQGPDPERLRVVACAKHYAVHSGPEALRNGFDARVSPKVLRETFLPHFRALVRAGVATVMGAYNAVNGVPCCGHAQLLDQILRAEWGFDGFVVSDAGAISGFHGRKGQKRERTKEGFGDERWAFLEDTVSTGHGVTNDVVESAAYALKNGCDMAIGNELQANAAEALKRGLIAEADLDRAVGRILRVMCRLGAFDAEEASPHAATPVSVIASPRHRALSRAAATRSLVLLKNDGVLPFAGTVKTVAVSGPTAADVEVLLGNFYRGISATLTTIVEGIVARAPDGVTVTYMKGTGLRQPNLFESTWSIGLAEWADVAVLCLGSTPLMEGENGECLETATGGDRDTMELPEVQLGYLRRVREKIGKKPIVVVLTGGSPIICPEVHELADAVLLAWYGGDQVGLAVGDALFGHAAPGGRLPFTVPRSPAQVPDFADYSMQGRTYRYLGEDPLYPFGFGLGYSRVEYRDLKLSKASLARGRGLVASVTVVNSGRTAVEEVAQLYIADHGDAAAGGPRVNLRDYQRVPLAPGASREVRFRIPAEALERVGEDGCSTAAAGTFTVTIGGCSPGPRGAALGAPQPVSAQLTIA
jgi:beta-glucosidase